MQNLPRRQRQIVEYIGEHSLENGVPPTYREIAEHFGVTISTVQEAIAALERKGVLERIPGKSRGLRIAEPSGHQPRAVPVVGLTTAGEPALAMEHIDGHLVIDGSLFPDRKVFALHVRGDSMIEAGILDGDYALVRRQNDIENGQIALVLVEQEEATIKRFYRRGEQVELRPANAAMQPLMLPAESVRIQGKVIGIYRKID